MWKFLILSCICLLILHVEAQSRPRNPTPPSRRVRKQPPARVLNQVLPSSRTRQRQQQIKLRQQSKKPFSHGRIKPATVRGYWDTEWCVESPLGVFTHDECDMYWYCDGDGNIYEDYCPDEAPIFDYEFLECMSEEDGAICWSWVDDGNWEGECPQDPSLIAFLPGDTCDDYYICLNGVPTRLFCAPGQHWNQFMEYCDSPAEAQCDPLIPPQPPNLPDCHNISGTVPHPFECRQFIYCQKNGSRMIQQCPHLHAFDADTNMCVIEYKANCAAGFRRRP